MSASRWPVPRGRATGAVAGARLCSLAAAVVTALAAAAPAAAITTVPGVRTQTVVTGVPRPTAIALDARGGMWIASSGNYHLASDGIWYAPSAGARPRQVVSDMFLALGLTWHGGVLYATNVTPSGGSDADVAARRGQVLALRGFDGRRFRSRRVLVGDLPVGRHTIDNVVAGPDGMLYVGLGSVADTARGPARFSASVLRVDPRTRRVGVVARGLRNPFGLAFIPGTRHLVVTDNGRDDLGLTAPPDEVNVVDTSRAARDYGFPGCWGQGGAPCRGRVPAVARTHPHASTDGVAVVRGFGDRRLTAFVANNGSTLFSRPVTSTVDRVRLTRTASGYRGRISRFAWGFRRFDPLGMTSDARGRIYLTLWQSGAVVRFSPR